MSKRGWLDVTDFFDVFPPEDVGDSFGLFDNKTGRVTKDDMVSGVQGVRLWLSVHPCPNRRFRSTRHAKTWRAPFVIVTSAHHLHYVLCSR